MPNLCTNKYCYAYGRYCRIPGHMGAVKKDDDKKEEKTAKKKIPNRSPKMKEAMKGYKKEAKKFLAEHPKCQVRGCTKKSDHIHHKAGRIGKNLTDTKNWMAVCAEHHTQIEKDTLWAKEEGYSVSRLTKHDLC